MKFNYSLIYKNKVIYSFNNKKDAIAFWKSYKEKNNIKKEEKAILRKEEIIPFRG